MTPLGIASTSPNAQLCSSAVQALGKAAMRRCCTHYDRPFTCTILAPVVKENTHTSVPSGISSIMPGSGGQSSTSECCSPSVPLRCIDARQEASAAALRLPCSNSQSQQPDWARDEHGRNSRGAVAPCRRRAPAARR